MRVERHSDTDTALIELTDNEAIETKEISESVYVDLGGRGNPVSVTIEHGASKHAGIISIFDRSIIHPGKMNKQYSRILHRIFNARQESTYKEFLQLTSDDAADFLRMASIHQDHFRCALPPICALHLWQGILIESPLPLAGFPKISDRAILGTINKGRAVGIGASMNHPAYEQSPFVLTLEFTEYLQDLKNFSHIPLVEESMMLV